MGDLGFWNIAEKQPDRLAVVDPAYDEKTYGELYALTNQVAHGLRARGLSAGDVVATLLPNGIEGVAIALATSQIGCYYVPINYHLTGAEAGYIIADSEAKVFVAHERFSEEAQAALKEEGVDVAAFSVGAIPGFEPFFALVEGQPSRLPDDRQAGTLMTYTSGTTGRPKGVKRPLTGMNPHDAAELATFLWALFGIETMSDGVHLVTAPLYHTAVSNFANAALNAGHPLVLMDQWSPEGTLERIERYRVTSTHMVPTMFHRLLKLSDDVKKKYDVSSMTHAIHSAAPCPIPTKHAMLEWWGPVIWEYYAATEGGGTVASPEDWLKKPGTVGKPWPISEIVVFDDDGNRLPPGEVGSVWMRMGEHRFEYHGDKEKTAKSWREGYFTVGDAGYLDEDGFLFLSDRKADMIISGGVNIYPAEIEAVVLQHPDVNDAAVFGIPHEDWGEEVKAAIQLVDGVEPGPQAEQAILDFCEGKLAKYKRPRSIDFVQDFPRDPNGKVYKRRLRDPYWVGRERAI